MKTCPQLLDTLNIQTDQLTFCCSSNQESPVLKWNPAEPFPTWKHIDTTRKRYIYGLNEGWAYHPCDGCKGLIDVPGVIEPRPLKHINYGAFTGCNSKCVYCDIRKVPEGTDTALLETVGNGAIMQLIADGALAPDCIVCFSNGEPTLSKLSLATLKHLNEHGVHTFLNTNGIIYSEEVAASIRSGIGMVQISIDSGSREDFLEVKGVDKFFNVCESISRYREAAENHPTAFYLKYIVFSVTNTTEKIDRFIQFCMDHRIRNVAISNNSFESEGHTGIINENMLRSYAYLSIALERSGKGVYPEYGHLTAREQGLLAQYIQEERTR
jgi:MoaA/NifB/PqqE/SkfB family radical SAM enzyme